MGEEVEQQLLDAVSTARDWISAGIAFDRHVSGRDDPKFSVTQGLHYMLHVGESEQRARWGPFGPSLEFAEGVFPQPLPNVDEASLDTWEHVAQLHDAVLQARFHDLLWIRRHGHEPYVHALSAIDAYIELAAKRWAAEPSAVEAIQRAIELSLEVADRDRLRRVGAAGLDFVARQSAEPAPGLALAATGALLVLPKEQWPPGLKDILAGIAGREDINEHLKTAALEYLVKLEERPEDRERWQRAEVETWGAAARAATGLVRAAHLQHAIAVARSYGLRDLADQYRGEVQQMTDQDFDLKTISADVSIPTAEVEAHIERFVGTDSWQDAINRFGARPAPSGDAEQNEAIVREQMSQFPLQWLATQMIVGDRGAPIAVIVGENAALQAAIRKHERFSLQIWGEFAIPVLERIRDRYGEPELVDLTEFFTTAIIRPETAERIARSYHLWWRGQSDEAAHVLLPRIEAVVRDLCYELHLVVYREPTPTRTGGVRLLGELIHQLTGRLDESWRRSLANMLTDELGYNLRNRALHGLIPTVDKREAALLLCVAAFLRTLAISNTQHPRPS